MQCNCKKKSSEETGNKESVSIRLVPCQKSIETVHHQCNLLVIRLQQNAKPCTNTKLHKLFFDLRPRTKTPIEKLKFFTSFSFLYFLYYFCCNKGKRERAKPHLQSQKGSNILLKKRSWRHACRGHRSSSLAGLLQRDDGLEGADQRLHLALPRLGDEPARRLLDHVVEQHLLLLLRLLAVLPPPPQHDDLGASVPRRGAAAAAPPAGDSDAPAPGGARVCRGHGRPEPEPSRRAAAAVVRVQHLATAERQLARLRRWCHCA